MTSRDSLQQSQPSTVETREIAAPAAWIDFADNGNIRFWTADATRAADEKQRGRPLRMFTLAELIALVAKVPATERRTFTIPEGHEPVRDADGRATGEVRTSLSQSPATDAEIVWLREIDPGTDNACWVPSNRVDPTAVPFSRGVRHD